ncbi:MAG: hypothetical protein H7Z42_11745, partial [Roseiflexaceae bacterium]|nr:hypothetical protein [Roseiflexaceae bacterium]
MTETASPSAAPDVGALLDELRAQVRARRLHLAQPEDDALARDLQRALDEIELHRVVSAHWPLIGRTLPERAMALINKLVRRYLRWYINPIVEQQNAYNDAVARTLRLLAEAYADLANQGSAVSGQRSGDEGQPTSPALQRRETGSGDEGQPTSPALQRRETRPSARKEMKYVVRASA